MDYSLVANYPVDYIFCGKCGGEMKTHGLARMDGLCQYCWDKWYRHEIAWIRRVTEEVIE